VAEVVTGDAVVLEVPVAAFPARMAARLIDMVIQLAVLIIVLVTTLKTVLPNVDAVIAIMTATLALDLVGYPTVFETLTRGRTPGKMALGLRVVADDGGPERFRQALVRALAGLFELWVIPFAMVALIASMASARGKRLGDMFAGTYVIYERVPSRRDLPPEFAYVPPPLAGWATQLELSRLADRDAEAASSFLRRYYDLQPLAREALGQQLAAAIATTVSPPPPPGTPPVAYLAAVVAVRRQRDLARLAAGPGSPAGQATPAGWTAPAGGPADPSGPHDGPGPVPGPVPGVAPEGGQPGYAPPV
jgi:uncharacterized RDD family membrane protein YckC